MTAFLFRWMRSISGWIEGRRARRRALAELNELDDVALADIGLSRSDIPRVMSGDLHESKRAA